MNTQAERHTPGSQYSKNRKKKAVKEKNMTESNEKSSTSKAYEGGSNGSSPNQKVLLNQFEQQFLSNCHKTPPPNNNHGDMAPQSLPQFVQMSQDLSQSTH